MKCSWVFILIILSLSCSSIKNNAQQTASNKTTICPNNGDCSIEIIKNKSILTNTDYGKLNYTLVDSFDKNVVRFEYKKDMDQSHIDGGYREEIVFEIDAKKQNKTWIDADFQQLQMYFGRYCYCRGQTGLYPIKKGILNLDNNDKLSFDLEIKIDEVPQITTSIVVANDTLKL